MWLSGSRSAKRAGYRPAPLAGCPRQWKLYCLVHNIDKLAHHGCRGKKAERSDAQR